MPEQVPIYRYTVTLELKSTMPGENVRVVEAMSFREEPPWLIFDDTRASVLIVRADMVNEIQRSPEPVRSQLVDTLTDPEPRD